MSVIDTSDVQKLWDSRHSYPWTSVQNSRGPTDGPVPITGIYSGLSLTYPVTDAVSACRGIRGSGHMSGVTSSAALPPRRPRRRRHHRWRRHRRP